ncbi:MAG: endonuclease VIII [Syntrophomonadaceae bacterium]
MLEIPEASFIASQIRSSLGGKKIHQVVTAYTPHKLAWFYGDPESFADLLQGQSIGGAAGYGGLLEIEAGSTRMLFGDGVNLRFHEKGEARPKKHQLLVEFQDGSALSASVQMYGGLGAFIEGSLENPYYLAAREKPSPLTADFNEDYFTDLITAPEVQKVSAKAFLATEQRIPGLGNGVLQDILYKAGIHPKKKIRDLSGQEQSTLYSSVTGTLIEMTEQGGRDTEKDLYGRPGGYITRLSKNTVKQPCCKCGGTIHKESYLGGSIYYCDGCQKL